ncbi:tripartite tricarboxylate transporter substrate binding protein [Polynucleobacter sp. UK-Mo-2m-Kol15]|uniref:Bug family tripartite tricarboxylate transporter substrate binding protein n=1 Tax=Polynucleobacter sp. UK-Mo-2m-Kol15 TaxID=2576916 RepID=UPI001C0D3BE0|nr:tripartite tricarboxylate transporter substrate binding protein [Polynucleobacter sp. UK-Mo-2m-Kol15]MBU3574860.1 tripartite tricarboxylate transporter substrate binding protein [Polynucleobacter sp. UK-Mo-2m-Kol15]
MKSIAYVFSALILLLASAITVAQPYPNRPIKVIIPFPAGGGTDIFARTVGQKLTENYKWTVVPENRPGAGGNLGIEAVSNSPADGYTIGLGQTSNLAINPTLYPKLPYEPAKDLTPIALVASSPLVIVVAANSPFKTFADIAAAAKAKPDQITYGSPGNGTVAHLGMELLQKTAGINLQHIPYKGSAQALTDIVGGQIQIYASSVPTAMGQIKDGRLRAIAVTSLKRSASLPETPTIAESGWPGFEAITWFGFVAPAKTPAPIIKELNANINSILKMPEVRSKLMGEGGEILGGTPEQFSTLLNKDTARWARVIQDANVKID